MFPVLILGRLHIAFIVWMSTSGPFMPFRPSKRTLRKHVLGTHQMKTFQGQELGIRLLTLTGIVRTNFGLGVTMVYNDISEDLCEKHV